MVLDWSNLLVLPSPGSSSADANLKVAAPCVGVVEPCGRSFHSRQFVVAAGKEVEEDTGANSEADAEYKEELRTRLDRKKLDLEDYYALMGLEKFGWKSTTEQIKKQWKFISFLCHPDKASPEGRPYAEKRFKAMQLAHTTLTDKQKRIGYDSQLPFDEKIPGSKAGLTEDTFYQVYAPVFERNARFSTKQPMPALGDKDTSFDDVDAFYDAWFGLKSWRDFTYLDEHKPDDGTDRFTRRDMERKNLKLRAGKKKEEGARVRKLVEEAEKKDPRVQRRKKQAADAVKAKKQAKKDEANAKVNAIADAKKAAAQLIEDAANAEKNVKDAIKKKSSELNALKKKLKRLCKGGRAGFYEADDVTIVCKNATHEQFKDLIEVMSLHQGPESPPLSTQEKETCLDLFDETISAHRSAEANEAAKAARVARKAAAQGQEEKDDAEAKLAQAKVAKAAAQAAAEPTEAEKQVAKKAEEEAEAVKAAAEAAAAAVAARVWSPEEEAVLAKAMVKNMAGIPKWPVMTDLVNDANLGVTRTKKEIIKKAKELQAQQATVPAPAAVAETIKPAATKAKKTPTPTSTTTTATATNTSAAAPSLSDDWTKEQQTSFVAALTKVKAGTAKRFEVIAPMISGKNKKECVQRFKAMKAKAVADTARLANPNRKDWTYDEDQNAIAN